MKSKEKPVIRIQPSQRQLEEQRRKAFMEHGPEVLEQLLNGMRSTGVKMEITKFEKAVSKVNKMKGR